MGYFSVVAATSENTVVTEYEPVKRRSETYQSEAELEKEFIQLLVSRVMSIFLFTRSRNLSRTYGTSWKN